MFLLFLPLLFTPHIVNGLVFDPEYGPYCEQRYGPPLCCTGRNDSCSLPRGTPPSTLCYCDEFCIHTHPRPLDPDCCPDYRRICLHEPDPSPYTIKRECFYQGAYYSGNTTFYDNCRVCRCVDMGNRMELMCSQEECLLEPERITSHNKAKMIWRAGNVTHFWGRRLEDAYQGMLGTNYSPRKVRTMHPIRSVVKESELPRTFDWRDKPDYVSPIVDQGYCNASWSYAIVSVFNDRLAKWSKGRDLGPLSYQQHRNCVRGQRRQSPCNSGHLTKSWKYLMNTGLLKESCYGVSMNSRCELPDRRLSTRGSIPCPSGSGERGKLYRASALSRVSTEPGIMKEIIDAGPVVASMRVFPDFFSYESGVYECDPRISAKTGRLHAVKIVGWGEDYVRGRIVPYWIAANSWGESWGEDGFFKIVRGQNTCDIEEFVLSFYINSRRTKRSAKNKSPLLRRM